MTPSIEAQGKREMIAALIERVAWSICREDLTDIGRRDCDFNRDFSEAERQDYRAKALAAIAATRGLDPRGMG